MVNYRSLIDNLLEKLATRSAEYRLGVKERNRDSLGDGFAGVFYDLIEGVLPKRYIEKGIACCLDRSFEGLWMQKY